MKKFDYDMIVIGGGAAGLTSSIWSSQLGARTLIIEKEDKLGGDCLHYGCVPSKSLLKSAHVYHQMRHAEDYGLPKSEAGPVEFAKIRDRLQGIIGSIQKHDSPEIFKKQHNIDTRFGHARFTDARTVEVDGQKISAKNFILATGSSPRIFPIEGLDSVKYITNLDVFSLDQLPRSMIILGGGPIGVEMAQAFNRLGTQVTVVETMDCIMGKEDKEVACFVHEQLEKEGVRFEINARGTKAEQSGEAIRLTVEYKDTSQKTLEAQTLLVATGRAPNVDGLNLEKAGVEFEKGGIRVDRHLRTSQKNIFACGDCNGGFQFTHVAEYEARIAALNARLPLPLLKTDFAGIAWCTFTDPEAASLGLNEQMATEQGIPYDVDKYDFTHLDRALAEGQNQGFVKILTDKKRRLIGAQIVGPHAGELIHQWVPVLHGKVDIGRIEKAMHIYPTLAQINKKVSGTFLSRQSALTKISTYLFK